MKNLAAAAAAAAILALSGCAPIDSRLVDTLDASRFVDMSRAMRPAMVKKHIVDEKGDWYSPLIRTAPSGAGKTLVDRLSPAFRFSGDKLRLPSTFRAMLAPEAKVTYEDNRAVIVQGVSRIMLELVAVTDWNNDGKDDWLVACHVGYVDNPRRYREYFLTVTDLSEAVLVPRIQMIIDHVYGKAKVVEDSSAGEIVDAAVVEFLPGQSTIVERPDREAVRRAVDGGSRLKERRLKD
ncbi:MAG: hypothetical protein MJ061_06025 [Mailhella sp.]|nr:hypothetical protein [Mailhella sp.]